MVGLDFTGRSVLVTGAASGIGKAVAQWLARHGIGEVIAVDIDRTGFDALDLSCRLQRICGDVADPAMWERLERPLDRLDHALINAGIADGCPLIEQDFDGWRRMLSVNPLAPSLHCARRCA